MRNRQAANTIPPDQLKPVLHEKIERMSDEQLVLLDHLLLQLETEQVADRLSEAFDADHTQGKFQRLAQLIRQVRAEHRYS